MAGKSEQVVGSLKEFNEFVKKRDEKGRFLKGHIPWNKGLTKESDEKVRRYAEKESIIKKGKHYSPRTEFKKGTIPWNKGLPKDIWCNPEMEARRLHRLREAIPNRWTEKEVEILKKCYPSVQMEEILKLLPRRSAHAIRQKAQKLGLRRTQRFRCEVFEKKVNLEPTEELAYVLGAVLGDGCIVEQRKKGNYIIVLSTTSKIFAESFALAVRKLGLHASLSQNLHPSHLGQKPIFYVRAHSKRLFSFIKNLTFPELKKILARESHAIAFLRGFYEAEGSFKRRGEMSISNSNRALLMFVGNLMGKVGVPVNVTGPYLWGTNRKPMFLIQVGKEKTKKFLGLVKPSIKCGVDG